MPVLKQLETPGANVQILFQCQHGVDECKGNAYESCLQDVGKEHQNFFPVFDCIEAEVLKSQATWCTFSDTFTGIMSFEFSLEF